MLSIDTFTKKCQECQTEGLAIRDFPFFPRAERATIEHLPLVWGGDVTPQAFSDVCFHCTPLMKSDYSGSQLHRPPTYQESSQILQPWDNHFHVSQRGSEFLLRELRTNSRDGVRCRICGIQGKLKRRSKLRICDRCFEALPTTIKVAPSRFDRAVFYPYQGILRRLGPYTWPRMEDVFDYVSSGYSAFVHWLMGEADRNPEDRRALAYFTEARRLNSGISPKRFISIGHYLYKKRITDIEDLKKFAKELDPGSRFGSVAQASTQIRYLLGDSFPYPDASYMLIRYGVLNRSIWGEAWSKDSRPATEDLLGVVFCPRVTPLAGLQGLNLRMASALLNRVPINSEFRHDTKLDRLQGILNRLMQNSSLENVLLALGQSDVVPRIRDEAADTFHCLARYPLPKDRYDIRHVVVDLGKAFLDNDEWWKVIQIAELIVRARLLESCSPGQPLGSIGEFWANLVSKMWTMSIVHLGPMRYCQDSFHYPPKTISSPTPQPVVTESQHERSLLHDQA